MIIFLYGPDSFRAGEKLNSLKKRFMNEVDKTSANIVALEGQTMSLGDLHKAALTRSFLARKRMVIVSNILMAKKSTQAETLDFLRQNMASGRDEESVLIFRDEKADERGALYKYLAGTKYREDFSLLAGVRLEQWIRERVESRGAKIENRAVSYLAGQSDGNLWLLAGELDKMIAYKRGQVITVSDAAGSSLARSEEKIFKMVDAAAGKNWRQAVLLAEKMFDEGAAGLHVLSMLSRQFRIIVRVKNCPERSEGGPALLAKKLKVHPFALKKAIAQAEKYSLGQLKKIFDRLAAADQALKSDGNERLAVEKLIMEIAGV